MKTDEALNIILVGYGEIGKSVHKVWGENHLISVYDPTNAPIKPQGRFDILLVAIPYNERFLKIVKDYQEEFRTQCTIIFSTVPIGTTSKLLAAVHSPVEGKHPLLEESIRIMPRWVGGEHPLATRFFGEGEFIQLEKPEHTELLKLQSTTKYGLNIEYARYIKGICDELKMDYELVKDFDRDYNYLYDKLKMPYFSRYIIDAPVGPKGGHCVVPNARILNKQYPNEMVKIVGEL